MLNYEPLGRGALGPYCVSACDWVLPTLVAVYLRLPADLGMKRELGHNMRIL